MQTNTISPAMEFDFGDGVPNLQAAEIETLTIDAHANRSPQTQKASGRRLAVSLTIACQLVISFAIANGADPLLSIVAAMGVMVCGMAIALIPSLQS